MQLTIVIIVIVIAVAYAAYRIYQTVSGKKSSCDGCPLAEKCSERQHKKVQTQIVVTIKRIAFRKHAKR